MKQIERNTYVPGNPCSDPWTRSHGIELLGTIRVIPMERENQIREKIQVISVETESEISRSQREKSLALAHHRCEQEEDITHAALRSGSRSSHGDTCTTQLQKQGLI